MSACRLPDLHSGPCEYTPICARSCPDTKVKLEAAFSAMRKDGNGLTLTQEQIILEAAR